MDFKEALTALQTGKTVRRGEWSTFGQMRLVDPGIEPDLDGPSEEFIFIRGTIPIQGLSAQGSQEEAEKLLTKTRKAHTALWNVYRQRQAAWDDATPEEQEKIPVDDRPIKPALSSTFWREVEVSARKASRVHRLSLPYFTVRTKRGDTAAFTPTTADLLAQDWKIA